MTIEQDFLNAARTGDQETFIRILNDHSINSDPNHADENGYTSLILAASIIVFSSTGLFVVVREISLLLIKIEDPLLVFRCSALVVIVPNLLASSTNT